METTQLTHMGEVQKFSLNTVVLHCPEIFTSVELSIQDGLVEHFVSADDSLEDIIVIVSQDEENPVAHIVDNAVCIRMNGRVYLPPKSETDLSGLRTLSQEYFDELGYEAELAEDETAGIIKFTLFAPLISMPEEKAEKPAPEEPQDAPEEPEKDTEDSGSPEAPEKAEEPKEKAEEPAKTEDKEADELLKGLK